MQAVATASSASQTPCPASLPIKAILPPLGKELLPPLSPKEMAVAQVFNLPAISSPPRAGWKTCPTAKEGQAGVLSPLSKERPEGVVRPQHVSQTHAA